jgi:hypothetical protein
LGFWGKVLPSATKNDADFKTHSLHIIGPCSNGMFAHEAQGDFATRTAN